MFALIAILRVFLYNKIAAYTISADGDRRKRNCSRRNCGKRDCRKRNCTERT